MSTFSIGCLLTRAPGAVFKIALLFFLSFPCTNGWGQIGGRTSADGPFTLDNVEDVNTTASGVERAWIPDYIFTDPNAFAAVTLQDKNLSLTIEQSPIGALRYRMPTNANGGYVSYSLGVPLPSVPGESTLTHPADITSFTHLTFLISSSIALSNQFSQVLMETYPGPPYPKLVWNFSMVPGTAFQKISLPLYSPDSVQDAGVLSVTELLAKVRYMSFYFYGGRESSPKTLTVYIDDVQLVGNAVVDSWSLY